MSSGSCVALYSSPNSFEMFYLCKVIKTGIASESLNDDYNHIIEKGVKYLKCNYLEKEVGKC